MPEKMRSGAAALLLLFLMCMPFTLSAHEDDYIVGLNAFSDGLYDVAKPSLEKYLAGNTTTHKADYSHYLLYQLYLMNKDYKDAAKHLEAIDGVDDRRFDKTQLMHDSMLVFTKTDCKKAAGLIGKNADETSVNYYLDSSCKPAPAMVPELLAKSTKDETRLKIASKFSDDPKVAASVFDAIDLSKTDDNAKKYFALYFYKHGDMDRFDKVRSVYEDADIAGLELDRLWNKGDKEAFISGFEKYDKQYKLKGTNVCRAIDYYNKNKKDFDCDLVNACMQTYSVDFVKVKGACLVKKGDKDKVTAFIDSLKPTIFPGMCGYGEYVFYHGLYTGKQQGKFYQCNEKYKIADVLMGKKEYQAVVNIFYKKPNDMDRYYTAVALKKLGKVKAADEIAGKIKDKALQTKYKGGTG